MRELYLHIGPQKTGSTYLQSVFARNKARLEAAGLGFAPYFNPRSGCHYLAFIAALRAKGPEAVLEETAAVAGSRVLVTDEGLARFLEAPVEDAAGEEPDRLWADAVHAAAARHFQPRIVYFARRQDHLAESHFAQGVRTWYVGRRADFPETGFDHDARLARLEAAFGRENITVILYRDGEPGDIAAEFFAAIGLEGMLPRLERDGVRRNVSPGRRKALLLACVPKDRRRAARHAPPGLTNLVVGPCCEARRSPTTESASACRRRRGRRWSPATSRATGRSSPATGWSGRGASSSCPRPIPPGARPPRSPAASSPRCFSPASPPASPSGRGGGRRRSTARLPGFFLRIRCGSAAPAARSAGAS